MRAGMPPTTNYRHCQIQCDVTIHTISKLLFGKNSSRNLRGHGEAGELFQM
jgi:hypothetical protein